MILIFGGTTEGRKSVSVCDGSAKPYYYSTKGDLQKVDSIHGIRITGGMNDVTIADFCKDKNIKLIIDSAHPFAEALHQNISTVSDELKIPVVRYERSYARHDENLLWFESYDNAIDYLEKNKVEDLLALTGVNTISKLKPYWEKHNCWFRILDREESRQIVVKEGFPLDKILYYNQEKNEETLYETLKPKAIITKESGESGGFGEKVEAARKLEIPLLVVKRPALSPSFISVYGENGLRKEIERLVPDFFELKTGYTTGTCATAATKAALKALLTNELQKDVIITLPNEEWVKIKIHSTIIEEDKVTCSVIKDAGDDPDITNGHEIRSTVSLNSMRKGVFFLQGEGVGKVTLPGLGIKIGEPAINAIPRKMIKREVLQVFRHYQDMLPDNNVRTGVDVSISVPNGEKIASRTFNPKLGIVGGISIIGTSGIVKPFSSEAFISSIHREMQVAKALGCQQIVINSGAKSERLVKQQYPLLRSQAFVHYGNFIGETIKISAELYFDHLTLGIMLGKAVKLAEGFLDTHSKNVVMNKEFLKDIALQSDCSHQTVSAIQNITMARQLWDIIPRSESAFFKLIIEKCYEVCKPLFPNGILEVFLIGEDERIIKL